MPMRRFEPTDRDRVVELWADSGLLRPWNDPDKDIARKLAVQRDGFLVATDRVGKIVGSVMAGYDGHRGWVNYIAVDPAYRLRGIGRILMRAAEDWLIEQGCPKLNLQLRDVNDDAALFYERLGYRRDAVYSYGRRLAADGPGPAAPAPSDHVVVLASRNAKKAAELAGLLAPVGWTLKLVSEFSDVEPEETAPSFIENALIKARFASQVSGLPALADDSGLEVAALNGAPGVRSARFAGEPTNDAANNALLLDKLRGLPAERRGARYVATLAFLRHAEDPCPVLADGYWPGRILDAPRGDNGFGYDPLFLVESLGRTAAEIEPDLKARLSHRARAMRVLVDQLVDIDA